MRPQWKVGLSLKARVGGEPAGSSLPCNAPRPTGENAGGGRLDSEEGPEANAGVSSLRKHILQLAGQVEVAIDVARPAAARGGPALGRIGPTPNRTRSASTRL